MDAVERVAPPSSQLPPLPPFVPSRGLPRPLAALGSGVAGALALNLLHEGARKGGVPHAPQVQKLGERGVARLVRLLGGRPPRGKRLYRWALAGDLLSNGLFYALVGVAGARRAWWTGGTLGALAGAGAVALPPKLLLGWGPTRRTRPTQAMTVLWYLAGGLAAAGTYRRLAAR
jgi:hypothetical protein